MGLILPRNKLILPSGSRAELDRSHPAYSPKLRYAGVAVGKTFVNLVDGKTAAIQNGAPTAGVSPVIGQAINFPTSSNMLGSIPIDTPTRGITMAAIFIASDIAVSGGQFFSTGAGGFNNNDYGIGLNGGRFRIFHNGTTGDFGSNANYAINTPYLGIYCQWPQSSSAIYQFGLLANLNTGVILSGTSTGTNTLTSPTSTNFNIGGFAGSNACKSALAALAYSNDAITLQDALAWARDPWSLWYSQKTNTVIQGFTLAYTAPPQTLTASLYSDSDTFYQPTVAPGAVTLTPSLYSDSDTFYQPTVAPGAVTLTAGLVTDTDTSYAPTASATTTLTAGLVTDTDTFYAPTVAILDQTLVPGLVTDTDSIYAPTETPGSVSLTPLLVTDTDTIYAATLIQDGALHPALDVDADTFYQPTVTPGAVTLTSSPYSDADVFYSPTVAPGAITLLPSLYASDDVFYAPAVSVGSVSVRPGLVDSDDAIYAASLNGTLGIFPALVPSDDVVRAAALLATHGLAPTLYASDDVVYLPAVSGGPISIHPSLYVDPDVFFTANVGIVSTGGTGGGGSGGSVTSDLKYASQFTMTQSGLIFALQCNASTAKTINTRMLIYADTGANLPGALLGQSAVKTSVVVGANNYPLVTPVSRLVGQKIWIALHSDGNFQWFLTPTTGGAKYNTDLFSDGPSDPFGPVSNDNKKAPVFVLYITAATASVTVPLVTDTDAFYAPTIGGSKTLAAPLHVDTDFFYAPSVVSAAQLAPSLVDADDAIYAPALARSALLPSLVVDTDLFYGPDVGASTAPNQDIFGTYLSADDVIYEPNVTPYGAALPPGLVPSDDVIYVADVHGLVTLSPALVADADTVYQPALSAGGVVLMPGTPASGEDFYDPLVTQLLGTRTLLPGAVASDDHIFSPSRLGRKSGRLQIAILGREDNRRKLVGTE